MCGETEDSGERRPCQFKGRGCSRGTHGGKVGTGAVKENFEHGEGESRWPGGMRQGEAGKEEKRGRRVKKGSPFLVQKTFSVGRPPVRRRKNAFKGLGYQKREKKPCLSKYKGPRLSSIRGMAAVKEEGKIRGSEKKKKIGHSPDRRDDEGSYMVRKGADCETRKLGGMEKSQRRGPKKIAPR